MSSPDINEEFAKAAVEPLLPIEKKLVAWSLVIGVSLLVVLGVAGNIIFPA